MGYFKSEWEFDTCLGLVVTTILIFRRHSGETALPQGSVYRCECRSRVLKYASWISPSLRVFTGPSIWGALCRRVRGGGRLWVFSAACPEAASVSSQPPWEQCPRGASPNTCRFFLFLFFWTGVVLTVPARWKMPIQPGSRKPRLCNARHWAGALKTNKKSNHKTLNSRSKFLTSTIR